MLGETSQEEGKLYRAFEEWKEGPMCLKSSEVLKDHKREIRGGWADQESEVKVIPLHRVLKVPVGKGWQILSHSPR